MNRDITKIIGGTAILTLRHVVPQHTGTVLVKVESLNPGGSVKDRIALAMIEDAEKKGLLRTGVTIVEPTSGNTGIALAMIGAAKGYRVILTMPQNANKERVSLLRRYGAEVVLTPFEQGMLGAVTAAEELVSQNPDYFMPQQFNNPANPDIHRRTTAREILAYTKGRIDAFLTGIGTGGTITGVGEVLKKEVPGILIVGVEPARSPLISKGKAGPHGIDGIGANFIPKVLNINVLDEIITVEDDEAYIMQGRLAREEGLLVGPSSGANVSAAIKLGERLGKGKTIVTILPDTGEHYLSIDLPAESGTKIYNKKYINEQYVTANNSGKKG
ncbi:MAG: cysteine synthase A [Dehalococcoidia bacterium]|nr:cysteine synthase A [Dehalococcoidia bacterium]